MPAPPTYRGVTRRSYTAGHFDLILGDVPTLTYVKSVDGGFPKMNASDDAGGNLPIRVKHRTSLEIEPMTLEVGLAQANKMMWWVAQSINRQYRRMDGMIIHADQDYKARFIHEFKEALIEEVAFPALDASSKDTGYLKVKIKPESVDLKMAGGEPVRGGYRGKQKLWTASSFRLSLDNGRDTRFVNKIDGFTIKQATKAFAAGPSFLPEIEPTKIEFPDLKVTMSLAHAESILDWWNETRTGRIGDTRFETTGEIAFLSPDRKDTLLTIHLMGVGIKGFNIPKAEANNDQIKRCTFDLYVTEMKLEGDPRLALEA